MSNVPLPAGTVLGKSFEYGLDVNLGLPGTPTWQPARRISAFAPTFPEVTEPITSYDDMGAPNAEVTGRGFTASFTIQGNRSTTTGKYMPELEAILAAAKGTGAAAVLDVRYYHKPEAGTPNPDEAVRASVTVSVTRQNTGDAQSEVFAVTLTGKGAFEKIANPFTGWGTTVPTIAAVGPAAVAAGGIVIITGTGFIGASSVKFGTPAGTNLTVISNSSIAVTMPAGNAGPVAVTVTTPAGVSTAFNYTRGA